MFEWVVIRKRMSGSVALIKIIVVNALTAAVTGGHDLICLRILENGYNVFGLL